jgi:hypothetical protein
MQFTSKFRSIAKRLKGVTGAGCLAIACVPVAAHVDVAGETTKYLLINFDVDTSDPGASQQIQYISLLNSILKASGHSFIGSTFISHSGRRELYKSNYMEMAPIKASVLNTAQTIVSRARA